jgi:hypothetical protein
MIYSPDSARRTPGAAAAASAYDGAKEVGFILANVAFREGWKIDSGCWLRVLFDWIGIFMEAGTGSQVQRDTTSNAILAKSFRKGLLTNSPVKRGRVWSKENGMESIVSTTGNGLMCGGVNPRALFCAEYNIVA